MSPKLIYKPRFNIAYMAKSKIWPYKDSYLRRFYTLRGRRAQRGGLFRRCVLVATTRKWIQARRFIRPARRAAGAAKPALTSKTAFTFRPSTQSIKQRYKTLFYIKQQLRSFHGKIKEEAFRQFFRNRLKLVGSRTYSFFDNLESRLDMIFFRRRFLPTIYACHQFIHHHGLEVNGNIVTSPRIQVRVGDMIAIPASTWKTFNIYIFFRIYYRRWGLYILRRRLFKQIKKKIYYIRTRNHSKKKDFFMFYKNYIKTKSFFTATNIQNTSQSFIKRLRSLIFKKKIAVRMKKKTFVSTISRQNFFTKKWNGLSASKFSKKGNAGKHVSKQNLNLVFAKQIKYFLQKIFHATQPAAVKNGNMAYFASNMLFRPFMQQSTAYTGDKNFSSKSDKLKKIKLYTFQMKMYSKILYKFITRFIAINKKKSIALDPLSIKKNQLLFAKLHQYQKIAFSLRLYKTFLPRRQHRNIKKYFKPLRIRAKRLRYAIKQRKKKIRGKKYRRRKSVHFFIPSYLQIDFRTLRAVKRQTPSREDIHYSFRISLPKVYSFYRSQGF